MADNIQLNSGSGGDTFAADDIGGVKFQRTKLVHGADGQNDGDVSTVNPLPVGVQPIKIFATTSNLAGSATYDSGVLDIRDYTQVQTNVLASDDGTMTFDFCRDAGGTDVVRTLTVPYVAANGYQLFSAPCFSDFVRYRFLNLSGSPQTDFLFETKGLSVPLSPQLLRADAFISPAMVTSLGRSVIVGQTEGGVFDNVSVDNGSLECHISSPSSAFGEVSTIQPTPVAQIDFVYGINTNLATTAVTGSGTATASGGLLTVATTAASSSSAQLVSKRYSKYRAGQGAMGRFTAMFTTGAANSKQYAGIGTASLTNGFFFGFNGATFGICHVNNGSETWIPQTSWNVDTCDGGNDGSNKSGINIDATKINVFQIKYQYLGAGNIFFYVENPTTGEFALVHQIEYAGANTVPSVSQPSLSLVWHAANATNASNIAVSGASGALFIEGQRRFIGPRYGRDSTKNAITTQTSILSLKNATTFNTITNRAQMQLRAVSIAANKSGAIAGTATMRMLLNATLGGSPSYAANDGSTADSGVTITSGQSVASYDTAGTTITNGTVLYNAAVVVGGNSHFDLTEQDIFVAPGDTLTISFESNDSCTVTVAVTWSEDL